MALYSCVVCGADLPTSVKRRVLHPPNEANADVHEFFVSVVAPGYSFASDAVRYACRYTCFSILQKAVKHHVALQGLLEKLRTNLPEAHTPTHFLSQSGDDIEMSSSQVPASASVQQSVRPIFVLAVFILYHWSSHSVYPNFAIMVGVWTITAIDAQEFRDDK